ncbi:hypothetical protein JKF63_07254 [Porcisia hertigi]|uniref:Uncharacterized protein n=1 Tax=Porcisia hertigi TaxID=2761500 RepID=A0A836LLA6_9TRYP|nr:hypothetical protein JKF63_07254 [Porcisia hertigi]
MATLPGASSSMASMLPPTAQKVTVAPAGQFSSVTTNATIAVAMVTPLHETKAGGGGGEEEEAQWAWKESSPSVTVEPTEECVSVGVVQAVASRPLPVPCGISVSTLSSPPDRKVYAGAPVEALPQSRGLPQQQLMTSPAETPAPSPRDGTHTCAKVQSANGVGCGHPTEPPMAATTVSHHDGTMVSVSVSSPQSSTLRCSGCKLDVDTDGDDAGRTVLLMPCWTRATSTASLPDCALPASTSDLPHPSVSPLSCASAAQAGEMRKAAVAPMSLERDDCDDCSSENEKAERGGEAPLVKAAFPASTPLSTHPPFTLALSVTIQKNNKCDSPVDVRACDYLSEPPNYQVGDEEGRGGVDQAEEEEELGAQQQQEEEEGEVLSGTRQNITTGTWSHHHSSPNADRCAEGGRHDEEQGGSGDRDDDGAMRLLSLTTSPSARFFEEGHPCSGEGGGDHASPPTPSSAQIVELNDTTTTLIGSEQPRKFKEHDGRESRLNSWKGRRLVTSVSTTSVSPVVDRDGLVFSPQRQQQMRSRAHRCRSCEPSQGGIEECAHLTPVPESPQQSPPRLLSPRWLTPHQRDNLQYDSHTPPAPALLFVAVTPPPAPSAVSLTSRMDNAADATDAICADHDPVADTALVHDSPPREINRHETTTTTTTIPSTTLEGCTSAAALRDTEVPSAPADVTCLAEAAEDGRGLTAVAVGVENESADSDAEAEAKNAGASAVKASLSCQRFFPERCARRDESVTAQHPLDADIAVCGSLSVAKAAGDSGEVTCMANAVPASVANALVSICSTTASPQPHANNPSFCASKPEEELPQQQQQSSLLLEDRAARRSVSTMDFRWADEADSILRWQQQRLRSLQVGRTAALTGVDACRSPSASRCSPCSDPLRYAMLSQDGGSAQDSQDGNGARLARYNGGSEASYSVSPQPPDPRAPHSPEKSMMGPGGRVLTAEVVEVALPSHRANSNEELPCFSVGRSGEAPAKPALASPCPFSPPASATAADDSPVVRTDRFNQHQSSPLQSSLKRVRERNGADDNSRSAQQVERRHNTGDCVRRRQRPRGDAAVMTATRAVPSVSLTNVFALPRNISMGPGASITAPPSTNSDPPLPPIRPRAVNCANAYPSATQKNKITKGKATHVGVTSSPAITAAAPASRENVAASAYKITRGVARHAPPLPASPMRGGGKHQRHQ